MNEILAANSGVLVNAGATPDAIELYNESGAPVNLAGVRLTDDLTSPDKFIFPAGASIPAGGYLTVFPTGEARPTASNLNFVAGQTVPNLAIVGLAYGSSASRKGFDIVSPYGDVDVVCDLLGWFRPHYASSAMP